MVRLCRAVLVPLSGTRCTTLREKTATSNNLCYSPRQQYKCYKLESLLHFDVMWTEEVHRNQLQRARRKGLASNNFRIDVEPRPNSGALPIVVVSALVWGIIWSRREGHKLRGSRSVVSWLQGALQRVAVPSRQSSEQELWREERPGALAAAAAERRLQGDNYPSATATSSKKKNKKKKKKGK